MASTDEDRDKSKKVLVSVTMISRQRFAAVATLVMSDETERILTGNCFMVERKHWESKVVKEEPKIFRCMHRVSIYLFNDLLRRIRNKIEMHRTETAIRSSESPICAEPRLEMTIRYLSIGRTNLGHKK